VPSAVEISGDICAAGAALAGLILVFIGAASTSYDAYERQEQHAVRVRYQTRAWIAFVGFAFSLLAVPTALAAKWFSISCVSLLALALLLIALVFALFAALLAVRDIQ
jgi:uncharacterized membrane protein